MVVQYTQPGLLYLNKEHPELAGRLELGLIRALNDGSYEQLFQQLLSEAIQNLNLGSRRYLNIDNPYLPESIKELKPIESLWFQP